MLPMITNLHPFILIPYVLPPYLYIFGLQCTVHAWKNKHISQVSQKSPELVQNELKGCWKCPYFLSFVHILGKKITIFFVPWRDHSCWVESTLTSLKPAKLNMNMKVWKFESNSESLAMPEDEALIWRFESWPFFLLLVRSCPKYGCGLCWMSAWPPVLDNCEC